MNSTRATTRRTPSRSTTWCATTARSSSPGPDGYALDRLCPDLVYIPADAHASVPRLQVWWAHQGHEVSIPLAPGKTYMTPSGYKFHLEKHPGAVSWRLIGTVAEGLSCHKPCTVSGGGKSEISKNLRDYMSYGPIFVADKEKDFDLVQQIFDRDYSDRWKPDRGPDYATEPSRPVLSPRRSLGSVIKLLTPSEDYTDAYNAWLASFPNYIYPIVFIIKRFFPRDAIGHWRELFGVDSVNGFPGHELKAFGRKLVGMYLRVGLLGTQAWRMFKLRQDFSPADKVQTEDDITASIVVPAGRLGAAATWARRPPPTSSWSTARRGCSSAPTTRSTAASTTRPRPTWRGRITSSPTSSR